MNPLSGLKHLLLAGPLALSKALAAARNNCRKTVLVLAVFVLPSSATAEGKLDCDGSLTGLRPPIELRQERMLLQQGDLVVTTERVFWKGKPVDLGNHMYSHRMLLALADRAGQTVSMAELAADVWPESVDDPTGRDYSINVIDLIRKLRIVFLKVDPDFDSIVTVKHSGYAWIDRTQLVEFQKIGDLEVNPNLRQVRWKGLEVRLARIPFHIFYAIVAGSPHLVLSSDLLAVIDEHTFDHVNHATDAQRANLLMVHIRKIRVAFTAVDPDFDALKTDRAVNGRPNSGGYFWQP